MYLCATTNYYYYFFIIIITYVRVRLTRPPIAQRSAVTWSTPRRVEGRLRAEAMLRGSRRRRLTRANSVPFWIAIIIILILQYLFIRVIRLPRLNLFFPPSPCSLPRHHSNRLFRLERERERELLKKFNCSQYYNLTTIIFMHYNIIMFCNVFNVIIN